MRNGRVSRSRTPTAEAGHMRAHDGLRSVGDLYYAGTPAVNRAAQGSAVVLLFAPPRPQHARDHESAGARSCALMPREDVMADEG